MRQTLVQIARESTLWDGNVVSARHSPEAFDLRCEVREKIIEFLRREFPHALPRRREDVVALPEADSPRLHRERHRAQAHA